MAVTNEPIYPGAYNVLEKTHWSYSGTVTAVEFPPEWRPGGLIKAVSGVALTADASPITVTWQRLNYVNGVTAAITTLAFIANERGAFEETVIMEPLERDEVIYPEITNAGGGNTANLTLTVVWKK